jgi:hypothetical protein
MSGFTNATKSPVAGANSARIPIAPKGPTSLAVGGSQWDVWPTNYPSKTNRVRPEGADVVNHVRNPAGADRIMSERPEGAGVGSHGCKPMGADRAMSERPGGADVGSVGCKPCPYPHLYV